MEQGGTLSILIVLVVAFSKVADCQEMQSFYVCEHNNLTIRCGDDEFIKIHDAIYGRKSSSICPGMNAERSLDCEAENSMQIGKNACENKTKCAIQASNEVFGDPCIGIVKYLAVTYTCEVRYTCPHDVININGIKLTFNAAKTDEEVDSVETCPMGSSYPNRQLATRLCTESWQEPMLIECYTSDTLENQLQELAEMNVTENVEEVAAMLALVSSQTDDITTNGLENFIVTLDSVVQVGSPSFEVTDSVVGSVNNIMKLDEAILAETPNVPDTLQLLEIQLFNVHKSGQNYTQVDPYLGVSALKLDDGIFEQDYTFTDHFTTGDRNGLEGNATHSSITLPSSIVSETRKVYPNVSIIPVSFISYLKSSLFQTKDDDIVTEKTDNPGSLITEYIDSLVIAATVELQDVVISNLPPNSSITTRFRTPIITFDLNETNTTVDFVCVFWVQPSIGSYGQWSTKGCKKVPFESEEGVICSCNHLTSFSVLVRVYDTTIDNEKFIVAFDIISMVGCIISIIGLSLSVIAILMIRPAKSGKRANQQMCINLNLCIALLGLYLIFLIGIDRTQESLGCRLIASFIHFFCLSSMSWMSVEAFNMFMLFWKMRQTEIKYLTPMAIALAWGVPLALAVLLFHLDDAERRDYCFLHPSLGLYFGFILPIFILFLFNSTVYILITYRVTCRKVAQTSEDAKRREKIARVKSSILLWILLGMCWTFGVLAVIVPPLKILFEVLFSICLALQGVFMFVLLVLNNPEIRKYTQG